MKKLLELINRVFLINKSNKVTVEPMQCTKNDKTIVVNLPNKHRGYFTSIFKQEEAETITDHCQRISVGILNKHLSKSIVIQKNRPHGFFVIEPSDNINIEHETATSAKNMADN